MHRSRTSSATRAVLVGLLLAPSLAGAAPSAFDASPAERALIVVDVRLWQKSLLASNDSPVVAGALRVWTSSAAAAQEPFAQAVNGVLPFAVEPGRYRPGYVRARVRRLQAGTGSVDLRVPLPTDSLPDLDRAVATGAVTYVGRLEVQIVPRPFHDNDYRFVFRYDRGRERQVWEQILEHGKAGAWEPAIRARLAAMSPGGDTTSAPHWSGADSTR